MSQDINGPNAPQGAGGPGSGLVLAGSSGAIQTNNGSGNFGSIAPGAGVATALAADSNTTGGLTTQNGAIVTGNLVTKSATGIQDSGLAPTIRVTVGQCRLPMILPSSGTMANNGALTLTTALDQTYPNAYFYMPAGAIVVASAAGFYYGTMSGASAVTLFNNLYVSGTPTIPASPTAFATTGPGAYTQSTGSNFTAYTLSIAGGTLGINDELQGHGVVSYNNSAGLKTFIAQYGSFLFGTASPSTTVQYPFQGGFTNAGILTRQAMTASGTAALAANTTALTYGSVNSASAQNLIFLLKLAVATDFIVLQNVVFERIIAASN